VRWRSHRFLSTFNQSGGSRRRTPKRAFGAQNVSRCIYSQPVSDPRQTYDERLTHHRANAEALRKNEQVLSLGRIVLFLAIIVVAAIVHYSAWVLVPVILFVILIVAHDRVIKRRRRADAAALYCQRGIERLSGQWQGKGVAGNGFAGEHHPFAADLDLFGKGSLFELLCIAVTSSGRATLAGWLLNPGRVTAAEVRERQVAVEELRARVELREEIFVTTSAVAKEVEEAHLDEWSRAPAALGRGERMAALVITTMTAVAFVIGVPAIVSKFVDLTNPGAMPSYSTMASLPLLVMAVIVSMFARRLASRVTSIVGAVERREPAFALLAGLLTVIEKESFTSPLLIALRGTLERDGVPASRQIERLRKLVALLEARRNQFFSPFALLFLWTTHIAFAIERWRAESGAEVVAWIEAIGEIEALLSLSSFAFEHPAFVMPEMADGEALFEGDAIGHPLIPDGRRVPNDVRIGGELRLLIVSGSNMSGKSTLMRSIGVNTLLALAGAPVCAARLRVTPMAVGASISLNDSLQEGASRFYAEILRIRDILLMPPPLLFLLDEVLGGTNSHDRRIGAGAILRSLVERGAIGLATTHDLALAQIAEELAPRAANVHFEDQIQDGRVTFDYHMQPGIVKKSNALELMRAVGIEV
jgi:hypothetical protein